MNLYFECLSGISGDMTIAALLDLGVEKEYLINELKKLKLNNYELEITKKYKNSILGTDFNVIVGEEKDHRHYVDIKQMILDSDLSEYVKDLSIKIFYEIAKAEAKIHGIEIDKVHFHEVGAVDSIIDIVAAAILIEKLDVDYVISNNLSIGTGFTMCQHGNIPIPSPATLEILKGIPIAKTAIKSELVTPTGAAIIKVLTNEFKSDISLNIKNIGYGLGKKDLEITNILRIYEIEKMMSTSIIETNIDDMNSEIYSYLMDKLFDLNALDVFYTPIYMKKNRPAIKLSVLVDDKDKDIISETILKETTTFGLRIYPVDRKVLKREIKTESTDYGDIRFKYGYLNDELIKKSPEYEDLKLIAEKENISIIDLYHKIK